MKDPWGLDPVDSARVDPDDLARLRKLVELPEAGR